MIIILTGIITEYNPFHNGHKYHLNKAIKETNCDGIVCVMSGNFMQRGNAALIDKWKRAEIAVKNGVDLVLELPLVYAVSSAEHFAFGSVSLLDNLNVIDNLYFGSESGNINDFTKISNILTHEPQSYKNLLKNNLDSGLPYHTSRSLALSNFCNDKNIEILLNNSNNILGLEYVKAINILNSKIKPYTLKREGNDYNSPSLSDSFSSATSIRNQLKNGSIQDIKKAVPLATYEELKNLHDHSYEFTFDEKMFKYIKYKILFTDNNLCNLPDISEGLDNKIKKCILTSNSLEELILNVKSKRYTFTRINRILTQLFLNLDRYDLLGLTKKRAPYARVLAFNNNGRKILKEIKIKSSIDIITKFPRKNLNKYLEIDIAGTKAYSLLNKDINPMDDYLKSPIII